MEDATQENFAAKLCENDPAMASDVTAAQEEAELSARAVVTSGPSTRFQVGTVGNNLHWILGTLRGIGSSNGRRGYANYYGPAPPPGVLIGGTYTLTVLRTYAVLDLFSGGEVPFHHFQSQGSANGLQGVYTGTWR